MVIPFIDYLKRFKDEVCERIKKSKKNRIIFASAIIGIILAGVIAVGVVGSLIMDQPMTKALGYTDEVAYSLSYWVKNPIKLILVYVSTLFERSSFYISSFIGTSLGWFDINITDSIVVLFVILICIASFASDAEATMIISRKVRLLMVLITIGTVGFICTGMLLEWTPASYTSIEGVQGRYFLPIVLLLLLPFRTKEIRVSQRLDKAIYVSIPIIYSYVFSAIISVIPN